VIEQRPRVAVVVLNWNALEETLACLGSLATSDWPRLTTIAVDNGSSQEIAEAVTETFPDAVVIRNPGNLGFSGGMNVGLRRALELGADYVLLLNNDTLVDSATVRVLVQAAGDHADAGIVCPVVLRRDAPDVVLSAGLRCDLRRGYQGRAIAMGQRVTPALTGVRAVDAPSGAAMLVSADVVRRVGMLDEELFLYGEDVEWSQRMRRHGLRVYVAADARLWHGLSVSSGGAFSPVGAYYQTRNSFVVCARYAPMRGPRSLLRSADILLANLAHARRARHPLVNVRAVLAGWRDYLRGRLGPCPLELLPPAE
jgi:GT2 family glycosyltransferase